MFFFCVAIRQRIVFILGACSIPVVLVSAQDAPSSPLVIDAKHSESSMVITAEGVVESVITGKVQIVRDEPTYKVKEISIVADDGNIYNVLLDGKGRKLVKVLKSRIVRVTGELKEIRDKKVLVIHNWEIIGSTKKPEVAIKPKVEPKAEPKHVSVPVAKAEPVVEGKPVADVTPVTNVEHLVVEMEHVTNIENRIDVNIATNVESRVEVKSPVKVGEETNAVISSPSNAVPSVVQ